ncbi:glycosyltransferase family 39 protein [Patescibacteria group bacterium]
MHKNKINRNLIVLITFLSIAVLLRLFAINQSLWLDEAIGANLVKESGYWSIINNFSKSDNHPPFYYLSLKVWSDLFGYSEIALRSLSVIFGVLSVYFTYKIALLLKGGKRFPIFSLILIATAPLHIYYSQEARMYIMTVFFATTSIYYFLRALSERNTINWILFSVSITFMIFSDYVPVFMLFVFLFYGIYKKMDRQWWYKYLISHIPILIIGIFWLPTFLHQVKRGKWLLETLPAWADIAGGTSYEKIASLVAKFEVGRITFSLNSNYYYLVGVVTLLIIVSLISAFLIRKKVIILWFWLVLPLILSFTFSYFFPAFIYFRLIYTLPAFYLLIAWGLISMKNKQIGNLLVSLIITANLFSWYLYISNPMQQREQWKQAVTYIEENIKDNDLVAFIYPEPFAPYKYYSKDLSSSRGLSDSISATAGGVTERIEIGIKEEDGIYLFKYLGDLTDPGGYILMTLENKGFKETPKFADFPGVGQVIYYKRQ